MPAKYVILIFSIFIVCCRENPQFPDNGWDYPKNISPGDTNFYLYQLKDILSERDVFLAGYDWLFYKPFNEPNLSIKQQPKETFRFSYETAFGDGLIITFNEDSMIVKKGDPMGVYKLYDTTRLSAIEKVHFGILRKWFPIDTTKMMAKMKKSIDSMIKLYPQLLDANYYHKLYDKAISYSGEMFSPDITRFPITKSQYLSFIQEINSSGFWTLPHKIDCNVSMADGYGFRLEANTRKKYKVVIVYGCPNDSSKLTKACQNLIDFAKQDKRFNLIWDENYGTVDSLPPSQTSPAYRSKH